MDTDVGRRMAGADPALSEGARMIEVMIERWTALDGSVDYRWSVWRDGRRVEMGGPHATADASEAAARQFCRAELGCEPDRLTRL